MRKPGAATEKPNNNRDVNANADCAVVQGGGLGGQVKLPSSTVLRHRSRMAEYAPWPVTPRGRGVAGHIFMMALSTVETIVLNTVTTLAC